MATRQRMQLACAVAAAVALVPVARPRAAVQAGRNERHVFVSVIDKQGLPVPNLGPSDFTVREDAVPREIVAVSHATTPMQMALLVDTSAAATPVIQDLRKSVSAFIGHVLDASPTSEITLYTFGERPVRQIDFTSSAVALMRAASSVFPIDTSGAFLHDAIREACTALTKDRATRPIIVAFDAENGPEFSTIDHVRVAELLEQAHATLWIVSLQPQRNLDPSNHDAFERSRVVSEVTVESGGEDLAVLTGPALERAFDDLDSRLKSEYDITYGGSADLVPPKRLEVAVTRPGLHVSAPRWPAR